MNFISCFFYSLVQNITVLDYLKYMNLTSFFKEYFVTSIYSVLFCFNELGNTPVLPRPFLKLTEFKKALEK